VVIGDCLRRQRQASQAQYLSDRVTPMARMVAIWGCSHRRAASSGEYRPTTLVQLEPIRTAATRAARAIRPMRAAASLRLSQCGFRSGGAYYCFSEATQTKRRDNPPRRDWRLGHSRGMPV
jgi:hypothetical protein